jgi:hypothetical protein
MPVMPKMSICPPVHMVKLTKRRESRHAAPTPDHHHQDASTDTSINISFETSAPDSFLPHKKLIG